jgi:hypothetical protein
MKERFTVTPSKVARRRKIQVRQFEPEELWIEYDVVINDPHDAQAAEEAITKASNLAKAYLDAEETRLRKGNGLQQNTMKSEPSRKLSPTYKLELTDKGKKEGLVIKPSTDAKFANFIHLWINDDKDIYLGYLRKDTGEFTFKSNNNAAEAFDIKKDTHFKVSAVA